MPTDINAYVDRALAQIRELARRSGAPDKIVIATYATREDYAELNRSPVDMSYDEHMLTVKRIGELAAQSGLADRVAFQDIESGEYWRWIAANGIRDTRAARGAFADLKYHGKLNSGVNLDVLKAK